MLGTSGLSADIGSHRISNDISWLIRDTFAWLDVHAELGATMTL